MANVQVDAVADIAIGARVVIRDSNDFVYVLVNAGGNIRAYKGNVAGEPASFAEQDAVGAPNSADFAGITAAIDSVGLIHVMYYFDDTVAHGGAPNIRYAQFRSSAHATTQDDWVLIDEEIALMTNGGGDFSFTHFLVIAIDANDDPHASWNDEITDMGQDLETIFYDNRIGGTWGGRIEIQRAPTASAQMIKLDLMIADPASSVNADRPIIILQDDSSTAMDAFHGTALNATVFTKTSDITGTIDVSVVIQRAIASIGIDSNEKITVTFIENTSNDLMIVEHLNSSAWGTWETPVDVDTAQDYGNPSIAIDGTNRYIFVEHVNDNDIHLWKDVGAGFVEETTDPDLPNLGTFNDVKCKWASKNNNSPRELDYVFEDSGGAVQYNTFQGATSVTVVQKTFTIDAILKKIQQKTFTLDARLVNRFTKTFSLDAILKAIQTKTFSIDAILKAIQTKIFSIDAILKAIQTKTFTIDARLVNRITKTFSIDSILKVVQTKAFTIDSILQAVQTKVFTIDAILLKKFTKDFSLDAILKAVQTKTFSIDSILKAVQTKLFTIDARLVNRITKTFSIDARLKGTQTKTFTIDANLVTAGGVSPSLRPGHQEKKEPSVTTTTTIPAPTTILDNDILLLVMAFDSVIGALVLPTGFTSLTDPVQGKRQSANACTMVVAWKRASSESGDYVVSWGGNEKVYSWLGAFKDVLPGEDPILNSVEFNNTAAITHTLDPATTTNNNTLVVVCMAFDDDDITVDGGFDADYVGVTCDKSSTGTLSTSGAVQTREESIIADPPACTHTLIASEEAVGVAVELAGSGATVRQKTFTINAILKAVQTKVFTLDAVLKVLAQTKTFTINARLVNRITKTFSIDARLLNRFTKTFSIDSILKSIQTKTFSIDALLKGKITKTFTIDARLLLKPLKTFSIDGILFGVVTKTFSLDAILTLLAQTKTFTIDAILKKVATKVFTADAILKAKLTKTFSVDAILRDTFTKVFSLDGILSQIVTKTFSIDGILKQVRTKTFSIDAVLVFGDVDQLRKITTINLISGSVTNLDLVSNLISDINLISKDITEIDMKGNP